MWWRKLGFDVCPGAGTTRGGRAYLVARLYSVAPPGTRVHTDECIFSVIVPVAAVTTKLPARHGMIDPGGLAVRCCLFRLRRCTSTCLSRKSQHDAATTEYSQTCYSITRHYKHVSLPFVCVFVMCTKSHTVIVRPCMLGQMHALPSYAL